MAAATNEHPVNVPGVYGVYPNLELGMYSNEDLAQRTDYVPLPQPAPEIQMLMTATADWAEEARAQEAEAERAPRTAPPIRQPPPLPDATALVDVPQRSVLWHVLRRKRVTASTLAALLGVLEADSASFLRDQQVKVTTPKPGPEHMQRAYESIRTTKAPRQHPTISSHEEGAAACAMEMGTKGEATAMMTYLEWMAREHPGWKVHEAGVAHLTQLPPSVAGDGISLELLPPIMVSPDGYVVRKWEEMVGGWVQTRGDKVETPPTKETASRVQGGLEVHCKVAS